MRNACPDPARQRRLERVDDPREGCPQPLVGERGLPILDREGREPDDSDQHRQDDDEPDRREEAAGQGSSWLSGFLGEVGDRLEAGVGKHGERQCEGDVRPRGGGPERCPLGQEIRRVEQSEPQDHEQELCREVEPGDCDPAAVEGGAPHEPDAGDRAITQTAVTASQGESRRTSTPSAVPR